MLGMRLVTGTQFKPPEGIYFIQTATDMKRAATKLTTHQCSQSTANTPHVGGPAMEMSSNVFIENMPALRLGDKLHCNAPNMPEVKKGSSVVFINGKEAAREGDNTSHQSVLIGGSAKVFIGG